MPTFSCSRALSCRVSVCVDWREISESESTKLSIIFRIPFLPPALLNKSLFFEKATHQQFFLAGFLSYKTHYLENVLLKKVRVVLFSLLFPQYYTLFCIVIVQILLEITVTVCGYKRLEESKSYL